MSSLKDPPKFAGFTWVCVNSSGGKDSQTALKSIEAANNYQGERTLYLCGSVRELLDRFDTRNKH